eukprot:TRINITY_DN35757_c0_g1_i2.p1 TRINITY_DN35757_c0_g1~~TRINITY_DN35757_c0_g1_i2.p1  ORF type:complete len:216 (-),score=41.00 TRINITY_DN35757_c0_g1_i2:174-821(-)
MSSMLTLPVPDTNSKSCCYSRKTSTQSNHEGPLIERSISPFSGASSQGDDVSPPGQILPPKDDRKKFFHRSAIRTAMDKVAAVQVQASNPCQLSAPEGRTDESKTGDGLIKRQVSKGCQLPPLSPARVHALQHDELSKMIGTLDVPKLIEAYDNDPDHPSDEMPDLMDLMARACNSPQERRDAKRSTKRAKCMRSEFLFEAAKEAQKKRPQVPEE